MKIFITGGTGYIGSAVIKALHKRKHTIVALGRNEKACEKLKSMGSSSITGNVRNPNEWLESLPEIDGVIHLAATFGNDMGEVDQTFIDSLIPWLRNRSAQTGMPVSMVYTGGVWLYGPSNGRLIIEGSSFNPPPEFSFMVAQREKLFTTDGIRASVVHPAMVWDETGGVIAGFLEAAQTGRSPRITGSPDTRWPMVNRADLAELYCLAVEKGQHGKDYHGVSEVGIEVGKVASVIADKYLADSPVVETVETAVEQHGSWVACRAFDQLMDAPSTREMLEWVPKQLGVLSTFTTEVSVVDRKLMEGANSRF